jgi:murein DD-endopeptidase MepM/ murein hydrolase activator NlpD
MNLRSLTLIVLSPKRGQVKQIKVAKAWLLLGVLAFVGSVSLGGYGLYHHMNARNDRVKLSALERENTAQCEQIKSIASEVDTLKKQLVRLHQFDRRIRVIANLEQEPPGVNLQGMGGVSPEVGVAQSLERETKERWTGLVRQELSRVRAFADQEEASLQALEQKLIGKRELLAHTPSIWPTKGWITSGFGHRSSPFTGLREFHRGLDVATRKGNPVISPADGVVVKTGKDRGFGRYVRLDHGFGYITYFAHLNEILVKKGMKIRRGQMIGKVGATGRTTGPHLHYEVHVNGLPVNPLRFILN